MPRALIIEDQAAARTDLRALLEAHREFEVVGEAATVETARELLTGVLYDLVFLDVQIVGGSGFELVPDVRAGARVIFVSAHDVFALRAFEVNALDYLLKPVKAERLAATLARAAAAGATPAQQPGLATAARLLSLEDIVHLSSGSFARFAPVADLAVIEAQENYSRVCLVDGGRVLVRRSLKAWEEMLPPACFVRVHRTALVNLAHVAGYDRDGPKAFSLRVRGVSDPVPVGREIWRDLKARLPGS